MTGYANGPSLSPGVGPHLQDRAARLDPSDRARDIFPLPCPPKVCQDHYLSRRSQQRFCRKARVLDDSREAVKALNWMNGFSPTDEFDFQPDDMQKEVVGRIMHLTKLAWEPGTLPIVPGCEAALKELLKGRSEYEDPALPVTLARFELERISMPETLDDVPEVADLLPEEARQYLKSPELMVREDVPQEGLIKPYWDPLLRSNKKNYRLLIQKLHSIRYLRFTQSPKAHAGMFFVHKSDKKKIRLIVDARPANQIFRSPPSVQLCTSEGFARIEVEVPSHIRPGTADFKAHLEARGLFFGLADVKDCFHRMRQPLWLSKYFCWDPIPVSWIKGLQGTVLEGKKLTSHDYVHPMPASLCMGFSWSLYFAQLANETLMSKIPSLVGSQLVSDKGPPIVFGPEASEQIRHYVYVDNLGIISPHEALVKKSLDELGPGFDDRGLVLHPGEIQHEHIQALGCSMRGDIMATRVSPSRFVRLRQAIGGVLQRKKVSGRLIEIVLGHVTFCCLCNRQLLSIFSAIYKFSRRNYFAPTKLWDSVRRELWAFRSLMIYLHSDWWRPWNPLVSSSDSSLEGYGISTSFWKPSDVAACGRRLERSRFKKAASTAARDHALTSAGFVKDDLTESWRRQEITSEELLEASGWEISDDFVEIPGRLLAKPLWEPKLWGRWGYEAGILELEGRALVKSLRRIALSPYGTDIRQLLLVDNMSVALAFDRFRSRNYRLLKQIRKFSSYLLSRNIATTVRWIPSELNSSDEPSRFFSQEESKLLTHLIPVAGNGSHGTKENSELGSSSLRAKEVSSSSERSPEAASKEVRPCQPKRCAGEDHSGARSADDPEPSTLPLHFARCGSLAARSESDESPEDPFSKLHQQHVRGRWKGEDGEEKESKAVSQIWWMGSWTTPTFHFWRRVQLVHRATSTTQPRWRSSRCLLSPGAWT